VGNSARWFRKTFFRFGISSCLRRRITIAGILRPAHCTRVPPPVAPAFCTAARRPMIDLRGNATIVVAY
jgi:hypothetical protein